VLVDNITSYHRAPIRNKKCPAHTGYHLAPIRGKQYQPYRVTNKHEAVMTILSMANFSNPIHTPLLRRTNSHLVHEKSNSTDK
jgi:hypothetical protein